MAAARGTDRRRAGARRAGGVALPAVRRIDRHRREGRGQAGRSPAPLSTITCRSAPRSPRG
ncbi:hypothetical protein AB5I41_07400 [Sphingomonas sp. MMS24-JH45]